MIEEVRQLLDQYIGWLRDKSALRDLGNGYVEITTPHLDRHNDYAQIYVRRENGGYRLTDGGETIRDLQIGGCELNTPKRKALLQTTLNGFGVTLSDGALEVVATPDTFSVQKHNLLQALLAVGDLFYLAQPVVANLFIEDVATWLDEKNIRSIAQPRFRGHSGYDHTFDFAIPKSRKAPERLIKAISRPNNDRAKTLAFSWLDTREVRPPNSQLFALLNDQECPLSGDVVEALRSYGIKTVPWSGRDKVVDALAA